MADSSSVCPRFSFFSEKSAHKLLTSVKVSEYDKTADQVV